MCVVQQFGQTKSKKKKMLKVTTESEPEEAD